MLASISVEIPESLLDKVLSLSESITDNEARAELLPRLALLVIRFMPDEALRYVWYNTGPKLFLEQLCTLFSLHHFARVLKLVTSIPNRRLRLAVFREISEITEEASSERIYYRSRDRREPRAKRRVSKKESRTITKSLTAAQINDQEARVYALGFLLPRLDEFTRARHLKQQCSSLHAIKDKYKRATALANLGVRLPEAERIPRSLIPKALRLARRLDYAEDRSFALAGFAPVMGTNRQVFREAAEAILMIDNDEGRAKKLSHLIDKLPDSILPKAFDVALQLEAVDPACRIINRWDRAKHGRRIMNLINLRRLAQAFCRNRPRLLYVLGASMPAIEQLGGQKALAETAQAIIDTARWWP
jgi:hypothetical protein